jgi:hypothetical protein
MVVICKVDAPAGLTVGKGAPVPRLVVCWMGPRRGIDVSEKLVWWKCVDVSGERTPSSLKVEWENGGMFVSAKLHGVTRQKCF